MLGHGLLATTDADDEYNIVHVRRVTPAGSRVPDVQLASALVRQLTQPNLRPLHTNCRSYPYHTLMLST